MPPISNNAAALGVAQGNNRLNSSGQSLGNVKSRTSLTYTNVVPAGGTLEVPAAGTQFYLIFSTAALNIRPSGGVFSPYQQGTGLQLVEANAFNLIEVQNLNAGPVVFQLFIGFDQFIDNRLVLDQSLTPTVAYPTYPVASAGTAVAINDLSTLSFTDINGKKWFAIQRLSIIVCNPDTGVTLNLQKSAAATSNGPSIAVIYPQTSLNLPVSGNYSLSTGGGAINAIVSELYQAIAATN